MVHLQLLYTARLSSTLLICWIPYKVHRLFPKLYNSNRGVFGEDEYIQMLGYKTGLESMLWSESKLSVKKPAFIVSAVLTFEGDMGEG